MIQINTPDRFDMIPTWKLGHFHGIGKAQVVQGPGLLANINGTLTMTE